MWVAFALLAWPLVEIALFVTVGGTIGLWATLLVVLGTGVLGAVIVRNAARLSGGARLRDPRLMVQTAARGGMTLMAGIMLMMPGFLTDVLGLILLIPPVQILVTRMLAARIKVAATAARGAARDDVIEGDFSAVPPKTTDIPSKWTQD